MMEYHNVFLNVAHMITLGVKSILWPEAALNPAPKNSKPVMLRKDGRLTVDFHKNIWA